MKAALVIGVALLAGPAFAQPQSAAGVPRIDDQLRLRYELGVMERVLETAVQHGAQVLGRVLQTTTPNLLLFTGPARARGFRLEGYGVFFDVEVPAVRRSVAWQLTVMNQPDPALNSALLSLKQHLRSIPEGPSRVSLEQALNRIEHQVRPIPPSGPSEERSVTALSASDSKVAEIFEDPNQAYTGEVKRALIDAMLDHSAPISIGPDEWLTVAARDNEDRLTPTDMYDLFTITLRIKGSDLAAFRADRMTREEARKRVEVRQF